MVSPALPREQITGLVLAGGRGSRMGGADKGLQPFHGVPLALHALQRLAPQVGPRAVNANRHLDTYAAFGHPVWPDAQADHPGPLAGMLAGLHHCGTPWLLTVPCDSPLFPPDLVQRLAAAALQAGADVALPVTPGVDDDGRPGLQPQPVFCLLRSTLADALEAFLASGRRRIDRFTATQRQVLVPFDDDAAFANANTKAELARLQLPVGPTNDLT